MWEQWIDEAGESVCKGWWGEKFWFAATVLLGMVSAHSTYRIARLISL